MSFDRKNILRSYAQTFGSRNTAKILGAGKSTVNNFVSGKVKQSQLIENKKKYPQKIYLEMQRDLKQHFQKKAIKKQSERDKANWFVRNNTRVGKNKKQQKTLTNKAKRNALSDKEIKYYNQRFNQKFTYKDKYGEKRLRKYYYDNELRKKKQNTMERYVYATYEYAPGRIIGTPHVYIPAGKIPQKIKQDLFKELNLRWSIKKNIEKYEPEALESKTRKKEIQMSDINFVSKYSLPAKLLF